MNQQYEPHTPRLKIVDEYIKALFRDELPDGIKYHDADHTLHPTRGVVAVANRIGLSENISEHDRELLLSPNMTGNCYLPRLIFMTRATLGNTIKMNRLPHAWPAGFLN
jgi:hypothetical protein